MLNRISDAELEKEKRRLRAAQCGARGGAGVGELARSAAGNAAGMALAYAAEWAKSKLVDEPEFERQLKELAPIIAQAKTRAFALSDLSPGLPVYYKISFMSDQISVMAEGVFGSSPPIIDTKSVFVTL